NAPPWQTPPAVHRSGRTSMVATTFSCVASLISTPISPGNKGWNNCWTCSSVSMRISSGRRAQEATAVLRRIARPSVQIGFASCTLRILQSLAQCRGEAQRLAGGGDQHDHDLRRKEIGAAAADALVEGEGGGRELLDARRHLEHLVDAGGPQILETHAAHDEGRGLSRRTAGDEGLVVVAH